MSYAATYKRSLRKGLPVRLLHPVKVLGQPFWVVLRPDGHTEERDERGLSLADLPCEAVDYWVEFDHLPGEAGFWAIGLTAPPNTAWWPVRKYSRDPKRAARAAAIRLFRDLPRLRRAWLRQRGA